MPLSLHTFARLLPLALLAACGQPATPPAPVAAPAPAAAPVPVTEPAPEAPSERELAAIARFQPQGDGATVLDTATGLTWMRCSLGQQWRDPDCSGEALRHGWDDAMELSVKIDFAGHQDWRLPSRDELLSITWCSSAHRFNTDEDGAGGACAGNFRRPAILAQVFPGTPAEKFWTATPGHLKFTAWGVSFANAMTGAGHRRDREYLRLVRGAPFVPAAQ